MRREALRTAATVPVLTANTGQPTWPTWSSRRSEVVIVGYSLGTSAEGGRHLPRLWDCEAARTCRQSVLAEQTTLAGPRTPPLGTRNVSLATEEGRGALK